MPRFFSSSGVGRHDQLPDVSTPHVAADIASGAITAAKLDKTAITGQTAKAAPVAADTLLIWDSVADGLKKSTVAQVVGSTSWTKLTDTSLSGGAAASLSSGTFTAYDELEIAVWAISALDAGDNLTLTFNNDGGANYAYSNNNTYNTGTGNVEADDNAVAAIVNHLSPSSKSLGHVLIRVANASAGAVKQFHYQGSGWNSTTTNYGGKNGNGIYVSTAALITRCDVFHGSGNNLGTTTRMVVWGRNIA